MNPTLQKSFGIDLGTTNSVISELVDGRPRAIPVDGDPIVPSVVLFEGERTLVGREARNLELQFPDRVIRSIKRKMGREETVSLGDRQLRPEEVSAEILRALKRGAEAATGAPVQDVVITVPAYFDDAQRRATLKAGELAGLNVLRLLNEPTSASLIYDQTSALEAAGEPELVLVYDLGGGTFDVSVLEVFESVREVRATAGNTVLGGDDFDDRVLQLFLDDLKRGHGVDPRKDPRAMARLRRLSEEVKIRLSAETRVPVREEFLTEVAGKPVHLEMEVSRRQLEEAILPLLESTVELARKALTDANVEPSSLSRICLVGGSTRIPLVHRLLREAFQAPIHDEIDVDLAVGLGASIQAGLLHGAPVSRILVDVTAHSLGVRALGAQDEMTGDEANTFVPLIPRNSVLPSVRREEFYTLRENQEKVHVEVFQGERGRATENTRVGEFNFDLAPAPESSPIDVEFAYDLNGVVKVSVSQRGTDNAKTVALSLADAGGRSQESQALGPVARKARALLETLEGKRRSTLEGLLSTYLAAQTPSDREDRESALLDFFLEHEGA